MLPEPPVVVFGGEQRRSELGVVRLEEFPEADVQAPVLRDALVVVQDRELVIYEGALNEKVLGGKYGAEK